MRKGWPKVIKARQSSPMGADREHPNGFVEAPAFRPSRRRGPHGREIPQAVRPPSAGRSAPKGVRLITIGYPHHFVPMLRTIVVHCEDGWQSQLQLSQVGLLQPMTLCRPQKCLARFLVECYSFLFGREFFPLQLLTIVLPLDCTVRGPTSGLLVEALNSVYNRYRN